MISLSWENFKAFVEQKQSSIQYIELEDKYLLWSFDGPMSCNCELPITDPASTEQDDFETNFKADGNQNVKQKVVAEPANLSLTHYIASDVITITAGDEETIDIELGQQENETQQILYGGALYAQDAEFEDYVKFQIVDVNNILGYGAGTVLKQYITKAYLNNNGTFEDYDEAGAYLPAGLFLRCIYKSTKSTGTTKVKINYLLGIP